MARVQFLEKADLPSEHQHIYSLSHTLSALEVMPEGGQC